MFALQKLCLTANTVYLELLKEKYTA